MPLLLLTALAHLAAAEVPVTADLPMPPPPPGLKLLSAAVTGSKAPLPSAARPQAAAEGEEAADSPESDAEVNEESAELEEMKALEEAALGPASSSRPVDRIQSLQRLGFGHPLRERMLSLLRRGDLGTGFSSLEKITDLASFDVKAVQSHYDIPVEMQPLVMQYIQFFQGPGRKWFRNWMSRSTRFIPMMQPVLEKIGVPKDTVYLAMIESGFSAKAYSWAHASGPWQFIATTGKRFGLKQDFWLDERRDPVKATHAAAKYLKELYGSLGHWYLAWAGYNAGGGRISKMVDRRSTDDFWQLCEGKGLAKETKHYVPKLIAAALVAKHYEAFGFSKAEFNFLPPLAFEEVPLTDPVDLDVLARSAGVEVSILQELNPELKRWCTPPASSKNPYLLKVPVGRKEPLVAALAKLPPSERMVFRNHTVRRGDTLSQIASRYGSAPEAIMRLNGLRSAKSLRLNTALMIPVPSRQSTEGVLSHQVARARRAGFVAIRPEEEIPAGTQTRTTALSGPVKTEVVNGKTRVTYGIASGDTLWSIAQRFDCSLDDLRNWNGITPKQKKTLKVGSLLTVWPGAKAAPITVVSAPPQPMAPAAAAPTASVAPNQSTPRPSHHVLASGESLWSVAQRYGVTVDELKSWNNIRDTKTLKVGAKLTLSP